MSPRRVAEPHGSLFSALRASPLFDGVPDAELQEIAGYGHPLRFEEGEIIIPEGEEGLGFYVVLSGSVRVSRGGKEVATLGAGDFFGEIAILQHRPRTATVRAGSEGAIVVGIVRHLFKPMLTKNPRVAMRILREEEDRTVPE